MSRARRLLYRRGSLPEHLTLFVTERCVLKCPHCYFLGRVRRPAQEMSLDEIERLAGGWEDLLLLVLTGGEPFLRDDLPAIAQAFHRRSRLRSLVIPTSGLPQEGLHAKVLEILERCPGLPVLIHFSIEGIAGEHDAIRGRPGVWDAVHRGVLGLRSIQKRHPNLGVGVILTCVEANHDHFEAVYGEARASLHPDVLTLVLQRWPSPEAGRAAALIEGYSGAARCVERDLTNEPGGMNLPWNRLHKAVRILTQRSIETIVRERRCAYPCLAGTLGAVIYTDGALHPCEVLDERIGVLRDAEYDIGALWNSPRAREVREGISRRRCFCTHECALMVDILFSPRAWLHLVPLLVRVRGSQRGLAPGCA